MTDVFNSEPVTKLVEEITNTTLTFKNEARQTTNKAAATRARKLAMKLRSLLKEYRKISIKEEDKVLK